MSCRAPDSDAKLAAAAAAGDAAAFAELYARHARAIFGYCRRILRSGEEAADATHEAFVSVLERLRAVQRPIVAPRPYLFRAAHNACMRIAGDRRRDDAEPPPQSADGGDLSDTERIVLTRELQDEVRAANDELSIRHREILALREVEQLRYDEIAQIMGTTPNAAAQLAWRARARLRTCLRRRAFDAIVLQTLDCERALGLLELAEDAGGLSPDEDAWLARHFVACPRCSSNRAVLADVGATYRSWAPAGAVPLLTVALLQRAGEVVGASWGAAGAGTSAGGAATTAGAGAHATLGAGAVGAASGGAVASVPSAIVVAAVGLAVGTHGTALHGPPPVRERAAVVRPPALVAAAVPRRAPGLSRTPVFRPAPEQAAPVALPAVSAEPPVVPAPPPPAEPVAAADPAVPPPPEPDPAPPPADAAPTAPAAPPPAAPDEPAAAPQPSVVAGASPLSGRRPPLPAAAERPDLPAAAPLGPTLGEAQPVAGVEVRPLPVPPAVRPPVPVRPAPPGLALRPVVPGAPPSPPALGGDG